MEISERFFRHTITTSDERAVTWQSLGRGRSARLARVATEIPEEAWLALNKAGNLRKYYLARFEGLEKDPNTVLVVKLAPETRQIAWTLMGRTRARQLNDGARQGVLLYRDPKAGRAGNE